MRSETELRHAIEIIDKSLVVMRDHGSDDRTIDGIHNVSDALRYALGEPSRLAFTLSKAECHMKEYEANHESR